MRLIDADELMREFAEFVRASNNSDFADVPTWNDAVSLLGSAPTIDPVKHGEWILLPSELVSDDGLFGEKRYACSNCGYERHVKHEFCPKCGAMMDGKEQKSYADWVVKRE